MGRILLTVLVLWVLAAGCGQPSSPAERQEKRKGVEQAEQTERVAQKLDDKPQTTADPSTAEATDPPKESGVSQEEFVEAQQEKVVEIEPPQDVPEYEAWGGKPIKGTSSKDLLFNASTKEDTKENYLLIVKDLRYKHRELDAVKVAFYVEGPTLNGIGYAFNTRLAASQHLLSQAFGKEEIDKIMEKDNGVFVSGPVE